MMIRDLLCDISPHTKYLIGLSKGKLNLTLDAAFNSRINYTHLAPSERDKAFMYAKDENGYPYAPAWWTINIKGNYAFSEHFLLTSGIENMMNYRYRPCSSGISAPGVILSSP